MPLNFRFPNKKLRSKIETSMNMTNVNKLSINENRPKSSSKLANHLNLFENNFQTTTKGRNKFFRPVQTQNLNNIIGFVNFENVYLKKKLINRNDKKYTGKTW